jgi:hypothetical protein
MLETAWESRWVPDYFKKITRESVLYRTDTFQWVEEKSETCVKECVNLIQQGSAVLYNWFLPVIRKFELIELSND